MSSMSDFKIGDEVFYNNDLDKKFTITEIEKNKNVINTVFYRGYNSNRDFITRTENFLKKINNNNNSILKWKKDFKRYVKIPETGIDDLSDGFHTFRQLYYQRMMLFATIVKQNRDKAWKSLRHEDGELCFGGGWFIVGIDTPEGSYTYHYENNFYSLFDCEELERGKHWDGHTEKDVTRLLLLPSADDQPVVRCSECKHWNEGICYCDDYEIHSLDYYVGDMYTDPDFFCRFGKRKGADE